MTTEPTMPFGVTVICGVLQDAAGHFARAARGEHTAASRIAMNDTAGLRYHLEHGADMARCDAWLCPCGTRDFLGPDAPGQARGTATPGCRLCANCGVIYDEHGRAIANR